MRDGRGLSQADLIRDCNAVGMTAQEIIAEYDIKPQYVYVTLWRLKTKKDRVEIVAPRKGKRAKYNRAPEWGRAWTDDEVDYCASLFEQGYSMGQIAREVERSRNAISGLIYRLRHRRGVNV